MSTPATRHPQAMPTINPTLGACDGGTSLIGMLLAGALAGARSRGGGMATGGAGGVPTFNRTVPPRPFSNGRSASANSAADAKRSCGSFASARFSTSPSPGGKDRPGTRCSSGIGGTATCIWMYSIGSRASNGSLPVSAS